MSSALAKRTKEVTEITLVFAAWAQLTAVVGARFSLMLLLLFLLENVPRRQLVEALMLLRAHFLDFAAVVFNIPPVFPLGRRWPEPLQSRLPLCFSLTVGLLPLLHYSANISS
jgi:hypothetical protein